VNDDNESAETESSLRCLDETFSLIKLEYSFRTNTRYPCVFTLFILL